MWWLAFFMLYMISGTNVNILDSDTTNPTLIYLTIPVRQNLPKYNRQRLITTAETNENK